MRTILLTLAATALATLSTAAAAQPHRDMRAREVVRTRAIPAPPRHWNRGVRAWRTHAATCMRRYRSFNPRTDTYVVRRVAVRCRL
jgi:BA14K-like protein